MTARMVVVVIAWVAAVAGATTLVLTAGTMPDVAASGMSPVLFGLSLAIVTDATVGALLTLRRPGNVVGLVLLVAAILMAVTFVGFTAGAVLTEQRGRHDLVAGVISLIGVVGIYPTIIIAGPMVALLFPNGHLPGPRWRWPVGAIAAAVAVGTGSVVLRPGPIGTIAINPLGLAGFSGSEPLWGFGESLAAAGLPAALALAIGAVIVRFRRSEGIERAQLKWFVAANFVFVALLTVGIIDGSSGPSIFDAVAPWSLALPPLAVGMAVLRYRLFEIDRIISRTLSWALVTGFLGAVFVGIVVGLQALSTKVTGTNTLAVAASTLVVAAAFQPLRRRVQGGVDRRFNRATYDAQRTTDAFAAQLRDEVDLARLRVAFVETVEESVRPVSASVWLRPSENVAR